METTTENFNKNLCGKTRPQNNPYEIWVSHDRTWVWKVLKKYQSPKGESENRFARWFTAVKSPMTYGSYELGDTYRTDIVAYARQLTEEEVKAYLESEKA